MIMKKTFLAVALCLVAFTAKAQEANTEEGFQFTTIMRTQSRLSKIKTVQALVGASRV